MLATRLVMLTMNVHVATIVKIGVVAQTDLLLVNLLGYLRMEQNPTAQLEMSPRFPECN